MSLYWICAHLSDEPEWFQEAIRKSLENKKPSKNSVIVRVDK
jgi:hypothetical protein